MRPTQASRLFYLSVFSLWASPGACEKAEDCKISPRSIVDDACASYDTLDRLNKNIQPALDSLTHTTDFFSHYRLNLFNKECPFWDDENGVCGNIACAVETLDNEEDIPMVWRASELGKLQGPMVKHPGKKTQKEHPEKPLGGELGENVGESCVVEQDDECDERDYCVPEDESASSKGDYVSLIQNPERFTGYSGPGAKQVWDAIYRENCFQRSSFPHSADLGTSSPFGVAENDFRQVLGAAVQQQRLSHPEDPTAGIAADDECLEKRVFYRVVSGMHASISAHLCWNFLNQSTGEWQPNVACYESRLHTFPDRLSNLYFNYALITRAVAKLGPHLESSGYTFCTGDPSEDAATRAKVLDVTNRAAAAPQVFDESLMFVNGEGPSLKEDFRNRFRNVSRLMDCVGCDKCRLWGKIQTSGYGTALKVLFELDGNNPDTPMLKRTELVALFNTHARLSQSLQSVEKFRHMLEGGVQEEDDSVADPHVEEKLEEAEMEEAAKKFNNLRRKKPGRDAPFSEKLAYEMKMFREALRVVVKSWVRFPLTLWEIVASETVRLYQFWIGLPVNKRSWKFQMPELERDEL